MKKIRSLILFGVFTSTLQAQDLTTVNYPTVFDQTSYAARLAYLSQPSMGFEINNRFIKELNVLRFFGACPFPSGVWSGMYKTYGYLSYREHGFAVGLSRILTPRLALGLQAIPKIETFGKEYESQFSTDLNATSFVKLNSNLYWDSEINFPVRISSNTRTDAPLQSFLRMSMSYVFSKQCQTSVSVKQVMLYKTEVNLQICYSPISSLMVFGNVGSSSGCGFGVQYIFGQMMCRFQTQYRPIVGYSTTVGLNYQFQTSKN
ncbi:MAG: hypothetical protein LBH22_04890 [Bacteroidales bacterium]|jgi:hypothetical protein|nr:hypothetical protein [Bacteroidales bacterium]